jgi:hypothetical protein
VSNDERGVLRPGLLAQIWNSITRPKTPRWYTVEIEKGVQVAGGDAEAIASLRNHPGMVALLNRARLRQAVLKTQLSTTRHKDIRDVDFLQSGLYWLGFVESELAAVTVGLRNKSVPKLADTEVSTFEDILSAIESIK